MPTNEGIGLRVVITGLTRRRQDARALLGTGERLNMPPGAGTHLHCLTCPGRARRK